MNFMGQLDRIREITVCEFARGTRVEDFIRHTVEEFGEFCQAVRSEDGDRPRDLAEDSRWEAGDLTICALSLFFARGGTTELLLEVLGKKLDKWEATLD